MSGWIVPVIGTKYPLNSSTFKITTDKVTVGIVSFSMYDDNGIPSVNVWWGFTDWSYAISYCTPLSRLLKFPVTPPTGVNKTWEITVTPEDIKIKCNTLEVLHFIFNNTYNTNCTRHVKGRRSIEIAFWNTVTATKMFLSEDAGK